MKKRVIMIMGVQRSGTNALFRSLARDSRYTSCNESADSSIFKHWYLKSEPEIRPFLLKTSRPLLIKPISETIRRGVEDVFREFEDYDIWIPWIYRDPVNVYYSHTQRWPDRKNARRFAEEWNRRNHAILRVLRTFGNRIGIVKYEDLVAHPGVFQQVCQFFDVDGTSEFRTDSAAGRKTLGDRLITELERDTSAVIGSLDAARRFLPGRSIAGGTAT